MILSITTTVVRWTFSWVTTSLMLMALAAGAFWPASYWMDIKHIFVHDTIVGAPPAISYSREVHHRFDGLGTVVIKAVSVTGTDGHFYGVCEAEFPAHARPTNGVKPGLTMDDWTFPTKCGPTMPPGSYLMETVWTWRAYGFEHSIAVDSNVFKVYPEGTDFKLLQ